MATPSEKLAESLDILHGLQKRGQRIIQTSDLTRTHRERLVVTGFLQKVIKGWYIPCRPDEPAGESTVWYASFWDFCSVFLNKRFNDDWCVSPEQSLSLHAGNWTVPPQLLVRSSMGSNKVSQLPFNTSIFDVRYTMPVPNRVTVINGLRVYDIAAALVACTPKFYTQNATDLRAILTTIRDASDVLNDLLEGGHSVIAGRLAGAFRSIGRDRIADDILETMRAAGYDTRETDPFASVQKIALGDRERSPYVVRMQVLWQEMRETVITKFPQAPGLTANIEETLEKVEEIYLTDAYHSLSIEGYLVSPELIERVRSGEWNSENERDKEDKNALAARGYWQAFQVVKESIRNVLNGQNPGDVAYNDHRIWYRELFGPSVTAGILKPSDLAGYRNSQVYIRRSMHVPPSVEAVRDLMPAFYDLLRNESEAAVRVVLGHFMFVNIHPYMDGNGRIGRFLMNVMLASGGYSWVVVPVDLRAQYMAALEEASSKQNIAPFTEFLACLIVKT
jgi:Fic/DOC family